MNRKVVCNFSAEYLDGRYVREKGLNGEYGSPFKLELTTHIGISKNSKPRIQYRNNGKFNRHLIQTVNKYLTEGKWQLVLPDKWYIQVYTKDKSDYILNSTFNKHFSKDFRLLGCYITYNGIAYITCPSGNDFSKICFSEFKLHFSQKEEEKEISWYRLKEEYRENGFVTDMFSNVISNQHIVFDDDRKFIGFKPNVDEDEICLDEIGLLDKFFEPVYEDIYKSFTTSTGIHLYIYRDKVKVVDTDEEEYISNIKRVKQHIENFFTSAINPLFSHKVKIPLGGLTIDIGCQSILWEDLVEVLKINEKLCVLE